MAKAMKATCLDMKLLADMLKIMNKYIKYLVILALCAYTFIPASANAENWERFKLHYTKPGEKWDNDGLPIGNGRLGAMCFDG